MATEILTSVKRQILLDKLALYRNTYYSHQVDARIGQDIADERMVTAAKENMRQVQRCLDTLEKLLNELEDDDGQDHGD